MKVKERLGFKKAHLSSLEGLCDVGLSRTKHISAACRPVAANRHTPERFPGFHLLGVHIVDGCNSRAFWF